MIIGIGLCSRAASRSRDGGYFIGRPMDPESRPAKTKKATSRVTHQVTWAGLETSRPRPMTKKGLVKKESKYNPEF